MLSLREMVLIGVVLAICLTALIKPKIGLLGYLWYGLARPDVICYVEDSRNMYSLLIFGATAIGAISKIGNLNRIFRSWSTSLVIALQIPIALSVMTAVNIDLSTPRYYMFVKVILGLLLIPLLVETLDDLKHVILTVAVSLGFVGAKFGIYGVFYGGVHLVSGYGPMLGDNNFVALALAINVPLCLFARALTPHKILRMVLLGAAICSFPGVIMTNSRGGILALALASGFLALVSKHKVIVALLVLAAAGGSIYMVADMFTDRMSTLTGEETEISAAARLWHLNAAVKMWRDHPLTGVGFGGLNYAVLSPQYESRLIGDRVAHNSWVQMLVDSGAVAFLLYTGAILGALVSLHRSARRFHGSHPDLEAISRGLEGAILVFAFGGTFYSMQRVDLIYLLLLITGAWQLIQKELRFAPLEAQPAAAAAPAPPPPPLPAPAGPALDWGPPSRARRRLSQLPRP